MIMFALFLLFPIGICVVLGVPGAVKFLLFFIVAVITLTVGFLFGLFVTYLFEPASYWQSYVLPAMWTNTYIDSLTFKDPMWKYILVPPYLFFADLVRIYVHFSIDHFRHTLFISEVVSWVIVSRYFRIIYLNH